MANPGSEDATVTMRFVPDGGAPFNREFLVRGRSRLSVGTGPGTSVPELHDVAFGVSVTSTMPIALERSMYWDVNGVIWAAGTNVAATAFGSVPIPFQF